MPGVVNCDTAYPGTFSQEGNLQVTMLRNCLRAIGLVLISHLVKVSMFFISIFIFIRSRREKNELC